MSHFPKINRLSSSIIMITCGAMLAVTPNRAVANSTSPSNYQNSCRNLQVEGMILSARCRRINGSYSATSIQIRGIENRDGNLTYLSNSTNYSNYQNSCRKIRVEGAILFAKCRQINGDSRMTSIQIRGIENQNGNLTYFR
jgi:hypothetical protein